MDTKFPEDETDPQKMKKLLAAMSPAGAMSGHKMVMSAERAVANKPMPSELKAPPAPTWFSQVGSTQVQTISLGGA